MRIELLHTESCLHWRAADENLKRALQAENIEAEVVLVCVRSVAEAERLQFHGSPTIRVDGEDWWRTEHAGYVLRHRLYDSPDGPLDYPSVDMLRNAFQTLQAEALAYIRRRADAYGQLVVIDGQNDAYSIKYWNEGFTLINYSPREGCEYGRHTIRFEQALSYLRDIGFRFSF